MTSRKWLAAVLRVLIVAPVVGVVVIWLVAGPLAGLNLALNDLYFKLRGPLDRENRVVLVAIDDASFKANGLQWPWPRDYLAQIVNAVAAGDPAAIGIDIFFYEETTPEADAELALAIQDAGNVVLVYNISFVENDLFSSAQLNQPIPALYADSIPGLTNFAPDQDGRVRRLVAVYEFQGDYHYSWALQLARLYEDTVLSAAPDGRVQLGNRVIRTDKGVLAVNFQGETGSLPIYSAYQVAERSIDPEVFRDKIVIIGATSESLHDTYATPFGTYPPMPGAEINGHAVEMILNNDFIYQVDGIKVGLLILFAALIGMILTQRTRPLGGIITNGIFMGTQFLVGIYLFIGHHIFLPLAGPLLATGLVYVVGTALDVYDERRKRQEIRSLFDRYVAPAAIDAMIKNPEAFQGGQRREVTILFSDIRGFTTLSESLPPDVVARILNQYLTEMTTIVFRHGGTVDNFQGDSIMAVFNAPLALDHHAERAVRCAEDMLCRLTELQYQWRAKNQPVLEIGIGINTGEAFVGNIGSMQRMTYTVIGDTVNLASRLQELTKKGRVPLFIGEMTVEQLTTIRTVFVATAAIRGRTQTVKVFTLESLADRMPEKEAAQSPPA